MVKIPPSIGQNWYKKGVESLEKDKNLPHRQEVSSAGRPAVLWWQQCYVECSVTYPNAIVSPTPISTEINNRPPNAAVTAYPTFIITFAALLFTLLLTSKRSH
ncbi:hypothetical protein INT48_007721 [Thamnidium elegans]|uniref:Uncharacterized protein n=1 Tax=Thamnidium elegans TaxID=101142 RepID=A0A8H7SNB8_9FUNG|nr:hypothetical protein INT48_007721 [Thamnidium elegans]